MCGYPPGDSLVIHMLISRGQIWQVDNVNNWGVMSEAIACTISYVLGRASSPEPAEPSLSKPKPSPALTRACSGLGPGFRFQKPKPGAQARALTPCGLVRDPRLEV
jgi:hypothetical protein